MDERSERHRRRRADARRRAILRRRRVAIAALAAVSALAGVVVGAGGGAGREDAQVTTGAVCPGEIAADPRRLAGRLLVVRMEGEATRELLTAARRGEIAGVIVFPGEGIDADDVAAGLERLQAAADEGGNPPLLVMIDQEGGGASRFPLDPPQRAPMQLAAIGSPRDARLEGQATGNFLAGLGIGINLAPVLDVPASEDSAMALRAFGTQPRQVSRLGVAFAEGLIDEGVAAVPKHFPGLGRAEVTTDAAPVTIDAARSQLDRDLIPFRDAFAAGAGMVMISLASYPAYGRDEPAVFSRAIVSDLLRGELGFAGVTVSDDLEAPGVSGTGIEEGEAAVAAVEAGVDLLLYALGGGADARPALIRAIRGGRLADSARAACARVVDLANEQVSD